MATAATIPFDSSNVRLEAYARLAGLEFAVQHGVEMLNEQRAALGMGTLEIAQAAPRRGRPPAQQEKTQAASNNVAYDAEASTTVPAPAPTRQRTRANNPGASAGGQATKERWAKMREAGLKPASASPTSAEVARAERIIARRAAAAEAKEVKTMAAGG